MSDRAESFGPVTATARRELGAYGLAVVIATSAAAALLAFSALFALFDDGSDTLALALSALVAGCLATWGWRHPISARTLRPVPTLAAAVVAFLVAAAISTLVYLVSGAFDRPDDAFYESITGVSTSSLTLLDDPSELGDGLLIWRAATQWMGGLAALTLGVALLPFLGGSRELADPRARRRSGRAFAQRPTPALRRVLAIYGTATTGVIVAFLAVGMGLRDAVAHAFSSVSTGGFSTHAESIAHYDSLAIEMAVIVAMGGAGSSAALVWMLWRRQFADTSRAYELRVYLSVLVAATVWIWWLNRDHEEGAHQALRESLFTVVSLVTTTGHRLGDWGGWHPGAVTLLLILITVGGMAGSVAGGLRWARVIGLLQFIWRELHRELHPRAVRSVKVGSSSISEASVDRMHSQLVYTMTVGTAGALGLALFGTSIVESVSLAVSAVSTTGPGVGDGTTIVTAAELSRLDRLVLTPLMLGGRVFLYPAFVLTGATFFGAGRAVHSWRQRAYERRARARR